MPGPSGGTPATPLPVVAIIPAKDEAARIAATIGAVRRIPGVAAVIVVDDGSRDATARVAAECGAEVLRHARNHGKATALMSGLGRMAALQRVGRVGAGAAALFVDADLEDSAEAVGALVGPVAAGEADLTIATLPRQRSAGGGRGLVVGLARRGIEELTGWSPVQPLSGMRCLSPAAVAAALPFARGWGVEVGMTVDVLGAGLVVREVPCDLHHRVTGTDWRAQLHRAAQYRDVALALGARRLRRRVGHRKRKSISRPAP
ncbi:MAG TPA: glycosyltransferase family 2 protein [Intrasporangium sp.]|nr:glycosyltransferase family 2 protein [Intrasporangium sp.]